MALADQGLLITAADKARDAYQIYPFEPEVWRAWGRVLTRSGEGRFAAPWWRKVAEANRLTVADRRDWVAAALTSDATTEAKAQVDWLLAQKTPGPSPADWLLAAREAAWHHADRDVETFDLHVLADPTASTRERFSAAAQILYLDAPAAESTTTATTQIVQLARKNTDPVALDALTLLAISSLRAPTAAASPGWPVNMNPEEIADDLDANSHAAPSHHLLALKLRAQATPNRAADCLAEAFHRYGNSSDDALLATLADWLTQAGQFETVLQMLPPQRARQSSALTQRFVDALAALGRWQETREVLEDPHQPLDPVSAKMYLAVVRQHFGESAGAQREWDEALEAAGKDVGRLLTLGHFAARNAALTTADAAFAAAIGVAPGLRPPYVARYQLALGRGQTALAQSMVAEVVRRWPGDLTASDEGLYLRLLLHPGRAEVESIERAAAARVIQAPGNWQVRTNLAVARLQVEQPEAALTALTGDPLAKSLPTSAPVRAQVVFVAASAANGQRDAARAEAKRLGSLPMLPEERALLVTYVPSAFPPEGTKRGP